MVLDADLLDMVAEFLRPMVVNDEELALDPMREVGPGGPFFGCAHTQARNQTRFFAPMISIGATTRACRRRVRRLLRIRRTVSTSSGSPPSRSRRWLFAKNSKLFVARRKAEGGVPTDY